MTHIINSELSPRYTIFYIISLNYMKMTGIRVCPHEQGDPGTGVARRVFWYILAIEQIGLASFVCDPTEERPSW
jgi:hypothetical protein